MQADVNSNPTKGRSRKRRNAFRLLAVLLGFLPFVLLEAGLRLADVAKPTRIDDPFVGFSGIHPLFELDEVTDCYRTVISRRHFFAEERFAAEKPENGFRVFCLGGSTVHGRPYQPDTAFSKWMQLELAAIHRDRNIEVVNCGGISYASYRLLPILREVLGYQPDLIVIATGHNEFLEDRTYQSIKTRSTFATLLNDVVFSSHTVTLIRQLIRSDSDSKAPAAEGTELLPKEVETRLDTQSGYASFHYDDQWRHDVVTHFESTMRSMVQHCRDADVPVILLKLGSNLRDCPPFKSEHPPELPVDDAQAWQVAFDKARAAESENLERALELYHKAEAIQAKHSLLAYRIARCRDLLDQPAGAREYYIKARQWDVCPLRALDETLAAIPNAIPGDANDADKKAAVIDVQDLIEQLSQNNIPGFDWYIDHVHPTIAAHQHIARATIAEIHKMQLLPKSTLLPAAQRQLIYQKHFDRLGETYLRNGGRRVGWLENWARRQRLHSESEPRDAFGFERLGHRYFDLGDHESAWQQYATAIGLDTEFSRRLAAHADRLTEQGREETAVQLRDWLQR